MDKETIMRMAREAGFDAHDMSDDFTCNLADIEHFFRAAHAAGAAAEREACVKDCQNLVMYGPVAEAQQRYNQAYWHCADAIRARSQS